MGSVLKSCLQSILKLVNSIIGMVGMALIVYALWMIIVWKREMDGSSWFWDADTPAPWFIYASLGIGVCLCVITCSGHIAAETANGHCLSCVSLLYRFQWYMVFVFLLVVAEAAVTADVFLNHDWEKDFPKDPTGKFDEFKKFVKSDFDFCKWIGLSIVAAQGFSILLSIILRAVGPDHGSYCDSDDEYAPARLPLLRDAHPPPYVVGKPHFVLKNDSWNIRVLEKANT